LTPRTFTRPSTGSFQIAVSTIRRPVSICFGVPTLTLIRRPGALGAVELGVGAGQRPVEGLAAFPLDHADAPFGRRGGAQAGQRLVGAGGRGSRHHQRELVAAEAGEHLGAAQLRPPGASQGAQQLIAGSVPLQVVDALEPVEVDQRDRDRLAVARGQRPHLLGGDAEARAVQQARERVGGQLPAQARVDPGERLAGEDRGAGDQHPGGHHPRQPAQVQRRPGGDDDRRALQPDRALLEELARVDADPEPGEAVQRGAVVGGAGGDEDRVGERPDERGGLEGDRRQPPAEADDEGGAQEADTADHPGQGDRRFGADREGGGEQAHRAADAVDHRHRPHRGGELPELAKEGPDHCPGDRPEGPPT
jgi:hypothetical protein